MKLPNLLSEAQNPGIFSLALSLGERTVAVAINEANIYHPHRMSEVIQAMVEHLESGGGETHGEIVSLHDVVFENGLVTVR